MAQNSYEVCGGLYDTEAAAAYAVVESFMYGGGINSAKEVARFNPDEIMRDLKDSDWSFHVNIVGAHSGYEDPKTEDVTPSDSYLREIIEEIIEDAKSGGES